MTRSWLYVSGARPEHFLKALRSAADAIVIDLEDSVAPDAKDRARRDTVTFLSEHGGQRTYVRVNAIGTREGAEDLAAIASVPLGGVRIPKAEDPSRTEEATVGIVDRASPVEIQPIIESAVGVRHLEALLSLPQTGRVAFGEIDLMADLGVGAAELLRPLYLDAVVMSRALGKAPPIQSVWTDLADDEGLRSSTSIGRAMGFFGRSALHPRQIEAIHQALAPTAQEVERARATLELLEHSSSDGRGAAMLPDGTFVDIATVRAAERIVSYVNEREP